MPATTEAVLERLSSVVSPDGTPLPATGTLSDIVVSDGKVFFSISVSSCVGRSHVPSVSDQATGMWSGSRIVKPSVIASMYAFSV